MGERGHLMILYHFWHFSKLNSSTFSSALFFFTSCLRRIYLSLILKFTVPVSGTICSSNPHSKKLRLVYAYPKNWLFLSGSSFQKTSLLFAQIKTTYDSTKLFLKIPPVVSRKISTFIWSIKCITSLFASFSRSFTKDSIISVKCPMFQSPGYPTRSFCLLWKFDINFYFLFLIFLVTHWPTKYLHSVFSEASGEGLSERLVKLLKNPSTLFWLSTCSWSLWKAANIASIQKNIHPINFMSEVFAVLFYTLMGVLIMGVFSIWAKIKKLDHQPEWHLKVH